MKIGPALHGDSLGFKSAETGQLNIHASQVEAQLPALQVIAGRAGELGSIVGEQNVAKLRLTSREAEVRAQETEGLSIKPILVISRFPLPRRFWKVPARCRLAFKVPVTG